MTNIIEPIKKYDFPQKWIPKRGYFYEEYIKSLSDDDFDDEAKNILIAETFNILGNCPNPKLEKEKYKDTGAVIGYVQSGKTTSFISLSAAAMDNGYDLIIVFGGRNKNLYKQNSLEYDSNFSYALKQDKAFIFSLDMEGDEKIKDIENLPISHLEKNKHYSMPLISVHLKHQDHIKKLTKVLKSRRDLLPNLNVMLIDDEADSASLNGLKDEGDESSIYKAIKELRGVLPKHAYIQYTATPQALLLSSRNDDSSPSWTRIITPGKKYVGTSLMFSKDSKITKIIPKKEYPLVNDEGNLPKSFYLALDTFLLSAAQSILTPKRFDKIVSMMVHPERSVDSHAIWGERISSEIKEWKQDIQFYGDESFLKSHSISFKEAYENLCKSNKKNDIASYKSLTELVPAIIKLLNVTVLNADKKNPNSKNKVSWKNSKYHIVIGGDLLDRGFVIKGLITTYMPRGKGVGNSDTIQQRGRFYGYKKDHLGFIRTWLDKDTAKAFKSYANTEKDLYERLNNHSRQDPPKPLQEWIRTMILDPKLKPCRRNIISIELLPNSLNKAGWFWTKRPMLIDENIEIYQEIINCFQNRFEINKGNASISENWTPSMKYLMADNLNLGKLLEFATLIKVDAADQSSWAQTLILLGNANDQGYGASIALMGTASTDLNQFVRSESSKTEFKTYQLIRQGPNQRNNFPGEEKIISSKKNIITFQFFRKFLGNNNQASLLLAIKTPGQKVITEITGLDNVDDLVNPFTS